MPLPASLYEAFPLAEARRIVKRLEFHHTPKRGSWLNMAEIEFSVLGRSCLGRRVPADAENWMARARFIRVKFGANGFVQTEIENTVSGLGKWSTLESLVSN